MKLHKITGANKYCGPGALSAVLGIPSHEASKLVRRYNDKQAVRGLHNFELCKTLEGIGVEYTDSYYAKPLTFAQWLQEANPDALYIVNVTRHYIVVKGNEWIDNITRKIQSVETFKKRARVKATFRIESVPELAIVSIPKPKFEGHTFQEVVAHYAPEFIEALEDRLESMAQERDLDEEEVGTPQRLTWAWQDLGDMKDCYDEKQWRVANLQLHRRGLLL